MRQARVYNGIIISVYTGTLLIIAFYLLLHEESLLHKLRNQLPIIFIARFTLFWFISLLFALIVSLFSLRFTYLHMHGPERLYTLRLCKMVLSVGAIGVLMIAFAYYCFQLFL